jgi:ribulose 1,5-bisphosphate carboxylase large subunit-like protein
VSFYIANRSGQSARADAHREALEDDVAGRRLVKEAEREEALEEGKPLHRALLSRLRDALRRRRD